MAAEEAEETWGGCPGGAVWLRAQIGGGVAEEVSVREEAVGGLFSGRD